MVICGRETLAIWRELAVVHSAIALTVNLQDAKQKGHDTSNINKSIVRALLIPLVC